jgi:hypothetical protein
MHVTHLPAAQVAAALEAAWRPSAEYPRRQAWPSSSPGHWVDHEEDERQQHTCAHWECQGQQAPGQTVKKLCNSDMAKVSALSGLMQRRRHMFTGSWLWCFGCCQQIWDNLNWVLLANSKKNHFYFFTIKINKVLKHYKNTEDSLISYRSAHTYKNQFINKSTYYNFHPLINIRFLMSLIKNYIEVAIFLFSTGRKVAKKKRGKAPIKGLRSTVHPSFTNLLVCYSVNVN